MATQWLRRAWLLAACASALLLASCGGGSIESSLTPSRVIAFGDAMADLGQNGRGYTINGGSSINNWTLYVASAFNQTLTASSAGGLSFATGNARVTAKPDAAGSSATPTVQEQISAFLSTGTLGPDDLVLVSAGTSDVITQVQAVRSGAQTQEDMLRNLGQAARELAGQVIRLVDAGGRHIVVAGPYNLGRSPWAIRTERAALMEAASSRFNQQLLVAMVNLGANVLYVDAALQFNLVTANPGAFELNDATTLACTLRDPGPGIGTDPDQVNSNLCTTENTTTADSSRLLFADEVYPTPRGHQIFGEFAFNRIRERW